MTALREEYPEQTVEFLCRLFGKRRQWYYANSRLVVSDRQRRKLIIDTVLYYRSCCPRIGGVKQHCMLKAELGEAITRGRDSFLRLLGSEGLMLPRNKRRRTTDSNHPYKKYPNLIQGITPAHVNQVWVSDITYVWICGDVLYLHLVTDVFSRAVIGWALSATMEAAHTREALLMAIDTAGGGNLCGTTHHSDRGSQYACRLYVETLLEHHIRISMTERYNPTDNPIAERQNATFKVEWIYQQKMYHDYDQAYHELSKAIHFYNFKRPHMSIGMKCPMDVYRGEEPGRNLWKRQRGLAGAENNTYL